MSYQKPYTFEERKYIRKLKNGLEGVFAEANDKEVEEWLSGYGATNQEDIIPFLEL